MARKARSRRGYSKRAHNEHPGVTISQEADRLFLRWHDPAPAGRKGSRRKELLRAPTGVLVPSRDAATAYAVRKAEALAEERTRLAAVPDVPEYQPDATWALLHEKHLDYLRRKGRSPSTLRSYKQTWRFIESWRARPEFPRQLSIADLEHFAKHVADKELSPHSVKTILVHHKAMINFGRKRMGCVRLPGETVAEGLQSPVKAELKPVALPTAKLRDVLDKASAFDQKHPGAQMFPLLAFLMLTGCRLGECEAVRWKPSKPSAAESWPDFDGGRLLIFGGKTSRQRSVSFETRPALQKMLGVMRDAADAHAEPYIFGGKLPLALRDKREVSATDADGRRIHGKSGKAALYSVRKDSGADWKPKDFRSTAATFLANSGLGLNLYTVAGELGHDYSVLTKHYAGQFSVPAKQRSAKTVEAVLGIADLVESWCKEKSGHVGKLIRLRRA